MLCLLNSNYQSQHLFEHNSVDKNNAYVEVGVK